MINNTFVINPVRPTFINRCLETLYKYTDMINNRVVVVDQTLNGLPDDKRVHLKLRPHRNLGFSKSMNEGIIHGLRWGSKYITCMNDDIEFIDSRWWRGIEETFKIDPRILAVNPNSPREPGWGYGLDHGKYIDLIDYKEEFTAEDYNFLLAGDFTQVRERIINSGNLSEEVKGNWQRGYGLPSHKVGVIDAIATWCTVFKYDFFVKFGMFEEKYYPGGGEDYDMDARCYRDDFRMVGTTKSWVWHWWGSSKDCQEKVNDTGLPIIDELRWGNGNELYPPEKNNGQSFDPWGKWTDQDGGKHPVYRVPEIGIVEI